MPPKKSGKKDGPAKFADKENLSRAETEILSLQRLLELRSYEVSCLHGHRAHTWDTCPPSPQAIESRRSERLWRDRNEAFTEALEQQREDTLDITSDMVG